MLRVRVSGKYGNWSFNYKHPIVIKNPFLLFAFSLVTCCFLFSCRKDRSCKDCVPGNQPPFANAGLDATILLPRDSITLDGLASHDPDGSIAAYLWSKISGPAACTIGNPQAARTTAKNMTQGIYQFELRVTDNAGLFAKDTITVTVIVPAPNYPPVANAGPDRVILLPLNSVLLDGSLSFDPENNITAYHWTNISGPSAFNIVSQNAVQTQVTGLVQGIYQFRLKVIDNGNLFSEDTVQVTVYPDTQAHTELIFTDLEWNWWHPTADSVWDEIYIGVNDTGNLIPDVPGTHFNVYARRDSTSNWEHVNPANTGCSPFYYILFPLALYVEVCPLDYSLIGKKGAIKVVY